MVDTFFGTKHSLTQTWDDSGVRLPVTVISAPALTITQLKTEDKDGYQAIQVAFGKAKQEIRVPKIDDHKLQDTLTLESVFKPGDKVNVRAKMKGKGFAGVVKRWGFKGGPKTHGQSDRQRAPGAIGQGTSPGRIHKGKKMPGHYGNTFVTMRNLTVVKIDQGKNELWLKGQVPGSRNSLVKITKV